MNVFVLRHEPSHAAIGAVAKPQAYWGRVVGLLASSVIPVGEGVWLEPCSAIHTIGMRSAVDVIFLDRDGRVLRVHERVQPNRPALICPRARTTIELGPGTLERFTVRPGDRLSIEPAVALTT